MVRRAAEVAPAQPVPVLSPEGFVALCRMPPLQVSSPALSLALDVLPGGGCQRCKAARGWLCMRLAMHLVLRAPPLCPRPL